MKHADMVMDCGRDSAVFCTAAFRQRPGFILADNGKVTLRIRYLFLSFNPLKQRKQKKGKEAKSSQSRRKTRRNSRLKAS